MTARSTVAALLLLALASCAGRAPELRHYRLAPPAAEPGARRSTGGPVLVIEELQVDPAYEDQRIAYRSSRYRIDYYHYHQWSAPPGELVAGYLDRALEASGRFGQVVREPTDQAAAILGGRLIALEEVDLSRSRWIARIQLELRLTDAESGDLLWSGEFEETQPLSRQSPEGLAQALSRALARIARRIGPEVARAAGRASREARASFLDN
jgi:ABC-type uncharacterized transport system auxiliary subunit